MKININYFSEEELQLIAMINTGKTFPEIAKTTGLNVDNLKYLFNSTISPKIFDFNEVQVASKKSIVDLKKEFKKNAYVVGRVLGSKKGKTFVHSKLVVVDTMFKTADNTDFKPLKIQESMNKREDGGEIPTKLSVVANLLNIKEDELVSIINIMFKDKVFIQNDFIISTNKRLSSFIPSYFSLNDDGETSLKEVFERIKKDKYFQVLLKRKPFESFNALLYYIRMQHRYFNLMPFLRYETGYELKKYFYKQIVPKSLDVNKIVNDAREFMENTTDEDLLCIDKFLKETKQIELDNDIVRTILMDSGYFSGVIGKIFCLKLQTEETKS